MWRYKLAGSVLGQVLRVWKWTVRLEYRGLDMLEEYPRAALALWHGRLLAGIFGGGKFCVGSMASQSPDGEVAARTAEALGVRIVRGSSTRGGQKALLRLFNLVESGEVCRAGLTVDGPKGPARQVKLGIVTLARRFGVPILPASFSSRPYWMLRSWDRMVLAPPFSRMILGVGSPMMVSDDLSDEEVALQLGRAIDRLTEELDRELHGRPLWEERSELR